MTKTRKNVRNLTFLERLQFVQAIEVIKAQVLPATGRSIYDEFVIWHSNATLSSDTTDILGHRNSAHGGPAFNPWHRFYLYKFEQELQKVLSDVTIPYWDWTQDANAPANSPIWADDFMGGNGDPQDNYIMKTGPFAVNKWTAINADGSSKGGLQRIFGQFSSELPTSAEVAIALQEVPYDSPSWDANSSPSHRNQLEGFVPNQPIIVSKLHNKVHGWIGGDMASAVLSPNDPVFFLHHCNVDRLWAIWQDNNPSQGYVPVSQGPSGHNLQDFMYPWDGQATNLQARPNDVLNYRQLGYVYA